MKPLSVARAKPKRGPYLETLRDGRLLMQWHELTHGDTRMTSIERYVDESISPTRLQFDSLEERRRFQSFTIAAAALFSGAAKLILLDSSIKENPGNVGEEWEQTLNDIRAALDAFYEVP